MAEEWDLSAIVRSCQSATTTATTEIPLTTTTSTTPLLSPPQNTTSASLEASTSTSISTVREEEYDMFSFPNLLQPIITNEFQELDQLLTPFNPTTNTSGVGINPNSPDFEGCIGQQDHRIQLDEHILAPPTDPSIIWHHLVPEASTSGITRFHDQHQSQQQQQQNQLQLVQKQEYSQVSQTSSSIVLPADTVQPQTPRSRKRKSQQKRMVCQVTADNLSADMWAWRKYGQKPIKGSPYPRNYYRCSSSKGCSARKQVERSNEEANMFIITYTGDHNHPRPTHRNSLAGSTRSKPSMLPGTQSSTSAVVVASPQPPRATTSSAHSAAEHENEEMMEPESPDPETEAELDPELGDTDWTGFSPG